MRYIPTRIVADVRVDKRYRQSGWIVFDTHNPTASHHVVKTKREATIMARNRQIAEDKEHANVVLRSAPQWAWDTIEETLRRGLNASDRQLRREIEKALAVVKDVHNL